MNQKHSPHGKERCDRRFMDPQSISRRRFLKGSFGAMVALPLLPSFQAHAQTPTFPKRFVVIHHPNGVVSSDWFPQAGGSESDFTLGKTHESLIPFQDNLILLSGISMPSLALGPGGPHQRGMGGVLSGWHLLDASDQNGEFQGNDGSIAGWGQSITVDQRIAQRIGRDTHAASLQVGVRATQSDVMSRISYLDSAMPLPPQNDPRLLFEQLFQDRVAQGGNLSDLRRRRKSVLDTVTDQFAWINSRLPVEERVRLESHSNFVREIEQRLDSEVLQGEHCSIPGQPGPMLVDDENNMPAVTTQQLDLMTLALACDLTRVITLQFSNGQNRIRFPWLDLTPENPDLFTPSHGDGHNLSHAGFLAAEQRRELSLRDKWYGDQVAYFLENLQSIPEGDGTLLDNTLVLWTSEISDGRSHSQLNMPFLLAGKGGSRLETGRHIQYPFGTSHCDFLTTLLRMFDIEDQNFGNPDFSSGPLTGLL